MVFRNPNDYYMQTMNNKPIKDFEGYSPVEMKELLNNPFTDRSPLKFKKNINSKDIRNTPFFNLILEYFKFFKDEKEIKLTPKGYLPTRIVKDLYNKKILVQYDIESGIKKLTKELDVYFIQYMRIITEISGIIKKRNNNLSFTKKGLKILENDIDLYKLIFLTYFKEFNWAYIDYFPEESSIQKISPFALILLNNYGDKRLKSDFYVEKIYKAHPEIIDNFLINVDRDIENFFACYFSRVFKHFLRYFGLVEITEERINYNSIYSIRKTELFHKVIDITKPKLLNKSLFS